MKPYVRLPENPCELAGLKCWYINFTDKLSDLALCNISSRMALVQIKVPITWQHTYPWMFKQKVILDCVHDLIKNSNGIEIQNKKTVDISPSMQE